MARKSSLASGIGGAAVAGFGASLGRDFYKRTKRTGGDLGLVFLALVIVAGAVVFPWMGGAGFTQGHDRGILGTFFKTIVGNLILIGVGLLFAAVIMSLLRGNGVDGFWFDLSPLTMAAFVTAGSTILGMMTGLIARGERLKEFQVGKDNARFLIEIEIRETGGSDITHYDGDGNALRFIESHDDRIVFMGVGKRGKRAYINMDADGRMIGYTGLI